MYKRPVVFSRPLIFATAFMSFFSVVIALFKVNASRFFFYAIVLNMKFFIQNVYLIQTFVLNLYRIYLTLKEIKYLASNLFQYV